MKIHRIFFAALLTMIMLAACSSTKLAEIYDEETVINRAKEVIELINAYDFDAVNTQLRDDLEDQLTSAQLKEALEGKLADAGTFIEYQSSAAVGQKSKSTGEDYATVVVVGKYENSSIVYTITMDSNLDIVGLYAK